MYLSLDDGNHEEGSWPWSSSSLQLRSIEENGCEKVMAIFYLPAEKWKKYVFAYFNKYCWLEWTGIGWTATCGCLKTGWFFGKAVRTSNDCEGLHSALIKAAGRKMQFYKLLKKDFLEAIESKVKLEARLLTHSKIKRIASFQKCLPHCMMW